MCVARSFYRIIVICRTAGTSTSHRKVGHDESDESLFLNPQCIRSQAICMLDGMHKSCHCAHAWSEMRGEQGTHLRWSYTSIPNG